MPVRFHGITIVFNVADIDRTERFYREHLGIDFARDTEEDGSVWLLARLAQDTELIVFRGEPQPGNTPLVVFGLPEGGIETFVEKLALAGVEIVTPVSEAPGGWSADFRDPDGQTVAVYQERSLPMRA